jgi:xanthine dehydrogenase YagS FAD-binding subunit
MRPLSYARSTDTGTAIALVAGHPEGTFLAGGTTRADLTRQDVLRPGLLVDICGTWPTPDREHPLDHGELITAIEVPAAPVAHRWCT